MPSREYHRVRIRLPARLRWTTPLGQKIELSETIDVSRSGLLLSSREFHAAGVPLWVTFPYDVSLRAGQPEVLARVVRCDELPEEGDDSKTREKASAQASSRQELSAKSNRSARASSLTGARPSFALAIHFKALEHEASNGNRKRHDPERRGGPRHTLAVPVRIRLEHVPWFEEAMTLDFSPRGMRFRSHREYAAGEQLKISVEDTASLPWSGSGEFRAEVVRVSQAPDGVALDVSVCRTN
jgi:PilZ domain-containing protein